MNSNCLLAFTKVMTEWGRVMLSHSVLRWFIADTINTETGTTGTVEFFYYKLEYFTEFYLFQAWTWRVTMLQIYVTLWGRWFVRVCVCVCVYLELLSHFPPFKIHLTNISPILIKMVDFKNLAWATSFATRASRKFIYLPYRASGEKSYGHTLYTKQHKDWDLNFSHAVLHFSVHKATQRLGSKLLSCSSPLLSTQSNTKTGV